jgi:hypothetical protein
MDGFVELAQHGARVSRARVSEQFPDAGCQAPGRVHDVGLRKVLCSTNAIESLNVRYRPAVTARSLSN